MLIVKRDQKPLNEHRSGQGKTIPKRYSIWDAVIQIYFDLNLMLTNRENPILVFYSVLHYWRVQYAIFRYTG